MRILVLTVVVALPVLAVTTGCKERPAGRGDAAVAARDSQAPLRETSPVPGDASSAAADGAHDAPGDAPGAAHDCTKPHPSWLLCEDFEGLSAGFATWLKGAVWTEALGGDDSGRMTASQQAHRGAYALYMPAAASAGYRGGDLVWRACAGDNKPGCKPLLGYQQLFLRAYIRFAPDHQQVHHFLSIGGGPLDDYWAPYGNAGCRPSGERAMGTTVDFKKGTHATFFYTYYPEMKCDPGSVCAKYADPTKICAGCAQKGMPCANGPECCWGNNFAPTPDVALPVDRWFCFEMTMRANTVGQSDGEMAYWIDGKLGHRVQNMHWRDVEQLQLNMVRLQHYITTSDAAGHSNRVWFDDVVVSTERIGCL